MVDFSGILGTGQVEDQKMIKDKLIKMEKIVSRFRGKLVMIIQLVVNLMIIQFRLKLDKSYCIGVMHQQKKI